MDFSIKTSNIEPTDLCICGHEEQYHDGGFGDIYCDGNGNHHDWCGGKSHTPNLCQCTRFELQPISFSSDNDVELDSPPFSPPELQEFKNRNFVRINREKFLKDLVGENAEPLSVSRLAWNESNLDKELQETINKANNYQEFYEQACEQIAEACESLGIDTKEVMADGWTLLERCKEIQQMGVVPLKLECPECHYTRAWTYPATYRLGDKEPNFVRCAKCGHIWSKEEPKKIILTDENSKEIKVMDK